MAADLRQLKGLITAEADVMIKAIAEATDQTESEVIRDVLHQWALRQWRICSVAKAFGEAEGLTVAAEVRSGTTSKLRNASRSEG